MAIEGGIFIDILTRLNMASVDKVLADVKLMMKEAGTSSGEAFSTSLDRSIAAGAKNAFDPLLAASDTAFRQMQIGMAELQVAEARINDLRVQNYKRSTDQMIAAQRQLDAAIANSQRLMADAARSNAAYRDSFIAAPALGAERGAPEERRASTGNNRETAPVRGGGEMTTSEAFAAGTATTAAGEVIAEGKGKEKASEVGRDVASHRIADRISEGARGVLRAGGIASGLALVGGASYGVRQSSRIQENLAQLRSLHGESPQELAAMTPAIWHQAIQTGFNTDELSKLYPQVEKARNPLTGGNYRGNDAINVAGTAAKLARVTGIDPNEAMQGLTTSLFNYKMGPSQATGMANLIAQGLSNFKGSAADYFEAQHTIEPVAGIAGIKAPEVFGMLDVASQTGQTAQQTAESTRNLIKALASPSGIQSQAMQQFGLNPEEITTNLSKNGLAGTMGMVLQAVAKKQIGPNGSVVLGALANKPLMEQQQEEIANQLSPEARKYMESDDFQKSLVSGFSARKILQKAGSAGLATSDMPLLQTWLSDQQKINGASDVIRRNQPDVQNLYGALKGIYGTTEAAQVAIMAGGSPEALKNFQNTQNSLTGAQNNPGGFEDAFKKAMDTNTEKWKQFGQALGNLSAKMGDTLLPAMTAMAEKLTSLLEFIDKHKAAEEALIAAMAGLTAFWVGQKTGLNKLIGKGVKAVKGRFSGDEGGGAADGQLAEAAETLQSASTTFEGASTTFETGSATFESAVGPFAEAVPIFAEAAPIFGEAVPIFSEAATAFSAGAAPFETGATTLETAASTMETTATTMETAATNMEAAATQLEGAATALDGAAGAIETGAISQDAANATNAVDDAAAGGAASKFGRGVLKGGAAVAIPVTIADALSGHNTPDLINNALHGKQENGQNFPYKPQTPNPQHPALGGQGLGGLYNIPKSQGGLGPEVPGHARGGVTGDEQPLLGQRDTGGDSLLGLLPNGQAIGLRGGEGILTPETVARLGGKKGIDALNAGENPWADPFKVGTTFYGSFAKGVAKYSPWGKYLEASSQSLDSLEKAREDADKIQKRQDRRDMIDIATYFGSLDAEAGLGGSSRRHASGSHRSRGGSGGGKYGGGPTGRGKASVMDAIAFTAQSMGLSQSELDDVNWIFSRESGFNPNAKNPSSGAYGLGQFLGHQGDKYGAMGAYSGDPAAETRAAITYMNDRYGGPAGAKAYWQTHGNYAHGGVVSAGSRAGDDQLITWNHPEGWGPPRPLTHDDHSKGNFNPNVRLDPSLTANAPYYWGRTKASLFPGDLGKIGAGEVNTHMGPYHIRKWHEQADGGDIYSVPGSPGYRPGFSGGGVVDTIGPFPVPGQVAAKAQKPNTTPPAIGGIPVPGQVAAKAQDHHLDYGPYGTNDLPGMPEHQKPKSGSKGHKGLNAKAQKDLENSLADQLSGTGKHRGKIAGGTAPKGDRNIKDNPSQQLTSEGKGFGIGGGLIGAAEQAAATGADMFAPGSGQGAQALFGLVNRAVGFGGQLLGIGMEGLMETFLPNDSPAADPSKNIFGKMALGIAGAHPSGNNLAGSHAKQLTPKKDLDAGSMQAKQQPSIHVDTIHNHSGDHKETFNAINKAVNFANQSGSFADK